MRGLAGRLLLCLALVAACGDDPARLAGRSAGAVDPGVVREAPRPVAAGSPLVSDGEEPAAPARAPEPADARLFLALSDAESGAPVGGTVQLWRLGLEETAEWTGGDHRQASLEVPPEGGLFPDLAEGRYRIYFEGQRIDTEDPPEFVVRAPHTELHFAILLPRVHPARLRVFDEQGRLLSRAVRRDGSRGRSWIETRPPWAEPRQLRGHGIAGGRGGHRSATTGTLTPVDARADLDGFPLGEFEEGTRAASRTSSHTFLFEGGTDVALYFRHSAPGPWEFVALSVPRTPLRDSIRVEGRPLPEAATFRAACAAVAAAGTEPRHLPVQVSVALDGYERLEFEYRLGDPLPVRELRRESEEGSSDAPTGANR